MDKKTLSEDDHYLFNVDILINARTHPLALQYLLELMNGSQVVGDFKINSELPLGKKIDSLLNPPKTLSKHESALLKKLSGYKSSMPASSSKAASPPPATIASPADAFGQIRAFIRDNRLVRLRANRQGKQMSLPCRILNFDEETGTINVYHVDEKQVYTFRLNEIDEFL
ncbi:hypothetical protein [Paenibacillus rhizophilus]|uniref:Uncharacterized protein n=1 Tax=Paenibacillus rhizophilus TaxID=1850366 RepID=A0A3N9P8U8_9BACL|nr:hypothetical protein [Paenibacillus rhizophilus]RQW12648.1 hypothetical protein EH198_06210 [Paenibacillus rhizophilus]